MEYIPRSVVIRIAIATSILAISMQIGSAGDLPIEEWNNTFGELDYDIGYSAQQTSDGGYIIAGETNHKAWLIKTDSKSKEQWNMQFERGKAVFVKQTSDGGYYLIGETTHGYGPRIGECTDDMCWDIWLNIDEIWLVKTNAKGKEQWNKTIKKKYSCGDPGFNVQQTSDGGFILATTITSYGHNYIINNAWLFKVDSEGNEQWSKSFGDPGNVISSVQQTTDGGYIFAGYSGGDAWLVKIDAKGNELWNKTFGGINEDGAHFVQLDHDGSYVIGGSTKLSGANNSDGWFIKVDASGNEKWNRTFGGPDDDYIKAVHQTLDGGYILVGRTKQAAWLIKTNSDGDEQWNKSFSGKNISYYLNSIQQTIDGGYILTGYICWISPSYIGTHDVWVLKIKGEQNEAAEQTKEIPTEKILGFNVVMAILALLTIYMFGGKILRLNRIIR